jgi:DNA-binding XRE family transcriptional regulator
MRLFCHLVIKGVRVDPPPLGLDRSLLAQLIAAHRTKAGIPQKTMAAQLGVSLKTLQNWERGTTTPIRRYWPTLRTLVRAVREGSAPPPA